MATDKKEDKAAKVAKDEPVIVVGEGKSAPGWKPSPPAPVEVEE
jgi:hypothetical protein